MSLASGSRVLRRYVVVERIGDGAMGVVYRARHESLNFDVALKVLELRDHGDLANRMSREARAMARVRHPNVAAVLDLGLTDDGHPCFVMELVDGESLDARLSRETTLPCPVALRFMCDVLAGLGAIHRAGIVHRDIKPANLLVARGEQETIKVIDLGIAQVVGEDRLTRTGTTLGTPAYMAPEQAQTSRIDLRADLYSAALVLYEMLTGTVPHAKGGMMAPVHRIVLGIPPAVAPVGRPPIPDHVRAAIHRALEVNPDQRYQTADELLAALLDRPATDPPQPQQETHRTAIKEPVDVAHGALLRIGTQHPVHANAEPAADVATSRIHIATSAEESDIESVTIIIVARLPPSILAALAERRWLASVARGWRTFTMAAFAWVGITREPSRAAATESAGAVQSALTARYAGSVHCEVAIVRGPIELSAAMMTGAAELPVAVTELIERLR